jgi:hypothetical protein
VLDHSRLVPFIDLADTLGDGGAQVLAEAVLQLGKHLRPLHVAQRRVAEGCAQELEEISDEILGLLEKKLFFF